MFRLGAAFVSGLLFGAGLAVSRMIDPAVVLAFLDVGALPTGGWDPSLALVMAGALAVAFLGYRLVFRRRRPWLAPAFGLPTGRRVDGRLLAGAALFGLGWGLVGYCPGPAIAGLGIGVGETWAFVAAMLTGMVAHRLVPGRRADRSRTTTPE